MMIEPVNSQKCERREAAAMKQAPPTTAPRAITTA